MELVYLWVEDYKNIHRQGFNFSPRFRCAYDPESNELTIDENDDHIENFFGDNINVTAIVGKNGSGKSSIFEAFAYLYWQGSILGRIDKTFFLYKKGEHFHIECENCRHHIEGTFEEHFTITNNTSINSLSRFSHRTNMPLISFSNCISDMTYSKSLKSLKRYDNFYNGIQPDGPMMKSENSYDNFNQKFYYLLNKDEDFFDYLDKKVTFDRYRIEVHITELEAWIVQIEDKDFSKLLSFQDRYNEINKDSLTWHIFFVMLFFRAEKIINHSENKSLKPETDNAKLLRKFIKTKLINLASECEEDGRINFEGCFDRFKEIVIEALCGIDEEIDAEIFDPEIFDNMEIVSRSVSEGFSTTVDVSSIMLVSQVNKIGDEGIFEGIDKNELLKFLYSNNILRINFLKSDSQYSFFDLSSGEKLFLNVLTNYAYTLFMLASDYKGVMFFDEIELSFHPDWQKRLLGNLLYLYRKVSDSRDNDLNIHMLFSSHSPFLLSDIPKQNIIFLDTNEEGKCKVLKHDEVMEKQQTFGANIHTLLSNSFFMSDGLMGEFAKGKIENVIEFLRHDEPIQDSEDVDQHDSNLTIEKVESIISVIGEPLLQVRLKKMLIDYKKRHDLFTESDIARQIEELQAQLREMRRDG